VKTKLRRSLTIMVTVLALLALLTQTALAQVWIHANGGQYFTQYGNAANFFFINNDGYCINGRGPCDPSLWYLQWTYNHAGCGVEEYAIYTMASVQQFNGNTYAWLDQSTGTMYGADYSVTYNGVSTYSVTVNQNAYSEMWATIASGLFKTSAVRLTDGWGSLYWCNGASGYQVEFDEIKLEI